jgi:methionyl-tRNA synthetase
MSEEKQQPTQGKEMIGIEEFQKLDLRIARILRAEQHPNADRLLKIQITLGDEERQIVAGIAPYYTPEELEGKLIPVLTNLKPVKLRGEWSHGMLLAASSEEKVEVLTSMREIAPGSPIS